MKKTTQTQWQGPNPFSLAGKVALVTGGGTGIGFAIAGCLVQAGARVVILGRRAQVLEEACQALGPQALPCVFDVSDTGAAEGLVADLQARLGRIDVLVNNAGLHCKKPLEETSAADLDALFAVHVKGAFALSRAVAKPMAAQGGGAIIMISSESAVVGLNRVVAYAAAKSAMLGITRSLAADLSGYGIRVNALIPGFIDTPMFRQATNGDPARLDKILGRTLLGRVGDPLEVGWAAVYLASDAASFVTGVELPVDGGFKVGF